LDGALNDTNIHTRSLGNGSESDFEDLRLGRSARGCSLDVESVKSAVANRDDSRVNRASVEVVSSRVTSVLRVSSTRIPVKYRLVGTSSLPVNVDSAAVVGESKRLSKSRRSSRKYNGLSNCGGLSVLAISSSVRDSESVVEALRKLS
jgi:hypothetical protein